MNLSSLPVLITRAQPGARETAARVKEFGATPILSPVLQFNLRSDAPLPSADDHSGLVFTSANGVRAFAENGDARHLPAWCVGPATAAAAREAGFESVHESAGNAVDLVNYIAANSIPASAPLLHVANSATKGDLRHGLEARGFTVEFAPLYEMRPADDLSTQGQDLLSFKRPAAVLIHSAKGAERFAQLALTRPTTHLVAAVISDAAARPLKPLSLSTIRVASTPNEDELLYALRSAIATLSA